MAKYDLLTRPEFNGILLQIILYNKTRGRVAEHECKIGNLCCFVDSLIEVGLIIGLASLGLTANATIQILIRGNN